MTKNELKKTQELLCAVVSAANQLEWYYNDYHNITIKAIADDLKKAINNYKSTKK